MEEEIIKYKSQRDDLIRISQAYLDLSLCAGGRMIHRRYCCVHCGSVDPDEQCRAPIPEEETP